MPLIASTFFAARSSTIWRASRGGFRDAQELRVESGAHHLRHILRVLRAVAAFGREERTAEKKLAPEFLAAVETAAAISACRRPCRPRCGPRSRRNRGRTRARARSPSLSRISTSHRRSRRGRRDARAHRSSPGSTVLPAASIASAFRRLRIGRGAFVNLRNLPLPNEHRAGLDHLAVADKNARVLDQPAMPAVQVAREQSRLHEVVLAPRLIRAEEEKRQQHHQHPELRGGARVFLLSPSGKASSR